mgnify:FL=1
MSMTFERFSDLQMWEVHPCEDDFEGETKLYPASFERRFDEHEVHVYFAGSDGCWKWYERPDWDRFGGWSYDMDGMHLFECLRECYDTLSEKGIVG